MEMNFSKKSKIAFQSNIDFAIKELPLKHPHRRSWTRWAMRVVERWARKIPPYPLWVTYLPSRLLGLFTASYECSEKSARTQGGCFRVPRCGGSAIVLNAANLFIALVLALSLWRFDPTYAKSLNARTGRTSAGFAAVAIHVLLAINVVLCLLLSWRGAKSVANIFTLALRLQQSSAQLSTYRFVDRRGITNLAVYLLVVGSFVPHTIALGIYVNEPKVFPFKKVIPVVLTIYVWIMAVPFVAESQFVTLCFIAERTLKAVSSALRSLQGPSDGARRPLLAPKGFADLGVLRSLTVHALRVARRANKTFGSQNLLNSLVCQCNLVLHLYVAASYTLYSSASTRSEAHLSYMVLHAAHLFLRQWFVALRCSAIEAEIIRLERLLAALEQPTSGPVVSNQFQMFRNELIASKVEFTACGFFRLNLEQISSMVATTTTYIVIFIQFQRT